MHLFISAGEPSGDLHGANLIRELRSRSSNLLLTAYGGERMRAAGAEVLYPLTDLALMGIGPVVQHLPTFFRIARQAEVFFRTRRPDAVVLIDYPGFHWALAKRAHRAGIPVYYFVPPQLWAWAGWRVRKVQRWVDTVLTALPFEETWYHDRGVHTHYIGHPYFDELAEQKPDPDFIHTLKSPGTPLVALLPGSRTQEVSMNVPHMLAAAELVRQAVPQVRFVVAAFKDRHATMVRELASGSSLPLEIHVKRTPEIIAGADAAIAVSGSVGLELMYHQLPSVVVYRVGRTLEWIGSRLATCKYASLVNLLADEVVFPEFPTSQWVPDQVARPVIEWLTKPDARQTVVQKLSTMRSQVAVPGATGRAAEFLLEDLKRHKRATQAG